MKQLLISVMLGTSLWASSTITLPENFRAKFEQKITNPEGKVIDYRGTVRFSHEKMLKWAYTKPTKKEVCTNGTNVTVVDHDLEQVSYYLITKAFDLSKVLASAIHHKDRIYIANFEGKQYTIQLDNKNRLQSVAYYDELDNKVQILFVGMKYGKGKLPVKSMLCDAPSSYDEIGA